MSVNGRSFSLIEPVCGMLPEHVSHNVSAIVVPRGFETDFATLPRIAQGIFGKLGKWNRAAILHDWLYRSGLVNRKEADKYFLFWMQQDGTHWFTARVFYLAVRLFGGRYWHQCEEENECFKKHGY